MQPNQRIALDHWPALSIIYKPDWAGPAIGDAFRHDYPFEYRVGPQRFFYQKIQETQQAVARITGANSDRELQPLVKTQLTPFYTDYPAQLSAFAAIGLTCFLEFKKRSCRRQKLFEQVKKRIFNSGPLNRLDEDEFKQIVQIVCDWIWTRLILEDLSRSVAHAPIEIYRVYIAARETLRFDTISEIIRAVVLFGDILPPMEKQSLHPLTGRILIIMNRISEPYFEALRREGPKDPLVVGRSWAYDISLALVEFMPPPKADVKTGKEDRDDAGKNHARRKKFESLLKAFPEIDAPLFLGRLTSPNPEENDESRFHPLDKPQNPALDAPENIAQHLARARKNENGQGENGQTGDQPTAHRPVEDENLDQALQKLNQAVARAAGQQNDFEDIRYDRLQNNTISKPFETGPMEDYPLEGHEIEQNFNGTRVRGNLHEKQLPTTDDWHVIQELRDQAAPITRQLERNLYPGLENHPLPQTFQSGGLLDSRRLALAEISPAVFKRYQPVSLKSREGRPLLVIACDGSASLESEEIMTLKFLSCAFLEAAVKIRIQVMAALYHSQSLVRDSPLIQWIFHPSKSPGMTSPRQGLRALAALPPKGSGAQSDAISISFLLDEARRLARGGMTYFILLTDGAWNRSYNKTGWSGLDEVVETLKNAYEEFAGQLDITVISTGQETGLDDLVEKVIHLDETELNDPLQVAEKISVYVSDCIRKRRFIGQS